MAEEDADIQRRETDLKAREQIILQQQDELQRKAATLNQTMQAAEAQAVENKKNREQLGRDAFTLNQNRDQFEKDRKAPEHKHDQQIPDFNGVLPKLKPDMTFPPCTELKEVKDHDSLDRYNKTIGFLRIAGSIGQQLSTFGEQDTALMKDPGFTVPATPSPQSGDQYDSALSVHHNQFVKDAKKLSRITKRMENSFKL